MTEAQESGFSPENFTKYPHGVQQVRPELLADIEPILETWRQSFDEGALGDMPAVPGGFDSKEQVSLDALKTAMALPPEQTFHTSNKRVHNLRKDPATKDAATQLALDFADGLRQARPTLAGTTPSSVLFYPGKDNPDAGWMGWHTNSDSPGWRLYANYITTDGNNRESYFAYSTREGEEIFQVDDPTDQWVYRLFFAKPQYDPFWHCVYTEGSRISVGMDLGIIKYEAVNEFLRGLR